VSGCCACPACEVLYGSARIVAMEAPLSPPTVELPATGHPSMSPIGARWRVYLRCGRRRWRRLLIRSGRDHRRCRSGNGSEDHNRTVTAPTG
jgi:hypothetical protein